MDATIVAMMRAEFPEVDPVNIEEALEGCGGDVHKCTAVLREILAEEAMEEKAPPAPERSILHALMDGVTFLCEVPTAHRPEGSRERLLAVCAGLEASGIHLSRPVAMLIDGVRDEAALTADLDEADSEVVRNMLAIMLCSTAPKSALSKAEMQSMAAEFGSSEERDELEARVSVLLEDLEEKGEGLQLIQQAVSQQRQQQLERISAEAVK